MDLSEQSEPVEQADDGARKTLEQMVDGFGATQFVARAAQLGIADLLAMARAAQTTSALCCALLRSVVCAVWGSHHLAEYTH